MSNRLGYTYDFVFRDLMSLTVGGRGVGIGILFLIRRTRPKKKEK